MNDTEQPPIIAPGNDWEHDLTPEQAQLRETTDLLAAIMKAVLTVDHPQEAIAIYAHEFMKIHGSELPQSAVDELAAQRDELLRAHPRTQ